MGKVTEMGGMFAGATSFNQNLRFCSVNDVNDCNILVTTQPLGLNQNLTLQTVPNKPSRIH